MNTEELQGKNPGSASKLHKVVTSKGMTMAELKGAQNCFFMKMPTEGGRLIKKICLCTEKRYLELIVQVETQRQPYKDSLSFSDSEIAERKTYQELAAENKGELQGTQNCPSLFLTSKKTFHYMSFRTPSSSVNKMLGMTVPPKGFGICPFLRVAYRSSPALWGRHNP